MKKISLLILTVTVGLFATTKPLHVNLDIYSDKAFLSKTYALNQTGEITIKIPQNIFIEHIRLTLDKSCSIKHNSIKKLDTKELTKRKNELAYKINALQAKNELLRTLSLKDVQDKSKIENITGFLVEGLTKNMLKIEQLHQDLKKINKNIKQTNRELIVNFTCKENSKKIKITYPLNSIKYTPFYNISANIHNKSVTIEKKAALFL